MNLVEVVALAYAGIGEDEVDALVLLKRGFESLAQGLIGCDVDFLEGCLLSECNSLLRSGSLVIILNHNMPVWSGCKLLHRSQTNAGRCAFVSTKWQEIQSMIAHTPASDDCNLCVWHFW